MNRINVTAPKHVATKAFEDAIQILYNRKLNPKLSQVDLCDELRQHLKHIVTGYLFYSKVM